VLDYYYYSSIYLTVFVDFHCLTIDILHIPLSSIPMLLYGMSSDFNSYDMSAKKSALRSFLTSASSTSLSTTSKSSTSANSNKNGNGVPPDSKMATAAWKQKYASMLQGIDLSDDDDNKDDSSHNNEISSTSMSSDETKKETLSSTSSSSINNSATESTVSDKEKDEMKAFMSRALTLRNGTPLPSLEPYRVGTIPSAYIINDWITETEETDMLTMSNACPSSAWTQLKRRSLQNWGGHPHPNGMTMQPLPLWLTQVIDRITSCHIFGADASLRPNHVLLNRYEPGQGIMPHKDGPLYYPLVAILSLGSHTVMQFYDKLSSSLTDNHAPSLSLWLSRRSLLIFSHHLYTNYFHAIQELDSDTITSSTLGTPPSSAAAASSSLPFSVGSEHARSTRVSLTIRIVPSLINEHGHHTVAASPLQMAAAARLPPSV
jgi:alkylated DNA repair protein alkB family protein 6